MTPYPDLPDDLFFDGWSCVYTHTDSQKRQYQLQATYMPNAADAGTHSLPPWKLEWRSDSAGTMGRKWVFWDMGPKFAALVQKGDGSAFSPPWSTLLELWIDDLVSRIDVHRTGGTPVAARKTVPKTRTLRGLKKEATQRALKLGHTLAQWPAEDDGRWVHTHCITCRATVVMDITADGNGTYIWGAAYNASCQEWYQKVVNGFEHLFTAYQLGHGEVAQTPQDAEDDETTEEQEQQPEVATSS